MIHQSLLPYTKENTRSKPFLDQFVRWSYCRCVFSTSCTLILYYKKITFSNCIALLNCNDLRKSESWIYESSIMNQQCCMYFIFLVLKLWREKKSLHFVSMFSDEIFGIPLQLKLKSDRLWCFNLVQKCSHLQHSRASQNVHKEKHIFYGVW